MLICKNCKRKKHRLVFVKSDFWVCRECLNITNAKHGLTFVNKVWLKDYGWTTRNEIKEVKSRVMLNYKGKGSDYDLGRINRWGRVEEKSPSYGDWG